MAAHFKPNVDEKRGPKAYVRCTAAELAAWRKAFGRQAVEVARGALIGVCVAGKPSKPVRVAPRRPLDAILTIRMTEGELWLIKTVFPPLAVKNRRGYDRYGPFVRRYMNRVSKI